MTQLTRRGALAFGAAALATPALAQPRFPDRPIRLVIPWPAGTSSDAQLRSLAELAGKALGQPVVAENRTGAGGTLGPMTVAQQARPDGYSLTQMHLSVLRRPWMMRTPQWDPVRDFTHIIGLTGWLFGTAIKADSPLQSWADMIAYAKRNPGKLTYSTSGIGTSNHLAMETLQEQAGIELTHVPFRGANEGVTAVLAGQVDMVCDSSAWAPFVESGQMRALSVWTAERASRFPNVPTLKELGHDMEVTSPYGISGPKGMDAGVVRVLHDALKAALFDAENARVRGQFDMPLVYYNTEDYRRFVVERVEYEKAMVRRLNLSLDG
ncbi:tripartite tricarboxylate transporter substrate binding protein [Siccirubricoccus sp. KC 17139]|uniref:Tripartite tricarboxylate transporter substrate binding protein n=1 Tax=Siccirubricoccus soli TaxID=2899147 RepID=A0ABT1D0E6_9PROT|nr:tripartite tricarboxylate transporter substrate binding protein [Siccirubricoccus soli]MCO6415347.1 tripartite tricarboxylate transporter substrate binding protein [Siccirubricoccus soli]MCP2681479.1 tripartite tricarboxylate transporter substrate binding protein [Siccirubricoccus soli]